jgi:hypothetical protein
MKSNEAGWKGKARKSPRRYSTSGSGVLAREGDARVVGVDGGDVGMRVRSLAGEGALAAADVERAAGAGRDRAEDQSVVVDVVVPRLGHGGLMPDPGESKGHL